MRIGMICPYSFDEPGGVQAHVVQICTELRRRGHDVAALAPGTRPAEVPDFLTLTGSSVGISYNGSVARLSFTPHHWRAVRQWLREGSFDVLHLHEPNAPSLSLIALSQAHGPIVATFHASTEKSLALRLATPVLRPYLERISGRIAVSDLARRWQVQALGSDAVLIPNGVEVPFFREAQPLPGYPAERPVIAFVGRFDESRKGLDVLLRALPRVIERYPTLEVIVIGGGDADEVRRKAGPLARHLRFLGRVSDEDKAAALRSADVYVAPNLGGESFGIVLVEAMAAGACVVASDLDAFRRVLEGGTSGILTAVGDPDDLARALVDVLGDDARRAELVAAGAIRADSFDWPGITSQVERVYDAVTLAGGKVTA